MNHLNKRRIENKKYMKVYFSTCSYAYSKPVILNGVDPSLFFIHSVVPNTSIFGPCFAFNPAEGIVMPGGHQAIQVAFNSPYLGDFEEVFCFQVDGQPQQCKIKFT